MAPPIELELLPGRLAICRLDAETPTPRPRGAVWSMTRCGDELSLVVDERAAPGDAVVDGGWRCLRVRGPLDLAMTGVVSGISASLADADVPLFVVSTHDTDLILVRDTDVDTACHALAARGYTVARSSAAIRGDG